MDNAELLNRDRDNRSIIENEVDTNIFVEASAGSGKTAKLIDRMLAMVASGIDVSKICAITFTKNAANEFYNRFRDKLSGKAADETDPAVKARYVKALSDIDLCFMGTIDSFCQMIVSEHPMEAGIPSDTVVSGDDELELFYTKELARVKNRQCGEDLYNLYRTLDSCLVYADDTVISQMHVFMNTRNTRYIYDKTQLDDVDTLYKDEIADIRAVLETATKHSEYLSDTNMKAKAAKDNLRNANKVIQNPWKGHIYDVVSALKKIDELQFAVDPVKVGLGGNSAISDLQKSPRCRWYPLTVMNNGHVGQILNESRYSVFMEFMEKFSALAAEDIKKSGHLGFFDYQICLLDMLRKDIESGGSLIRHIYERHSYYLIDEFQDTNPMQIEMFFYITAEEPKADWTKCVPRPGSLFIVGDPKQSIYRFRCADVASYNSVKSLFKEPVGRTVHLFRNFRSTDKLREGFNTMFPSILPTGESDDSGQSIFEQIPGENDGEQDVESTLSGIFSYAGSEVPLEDAETVADIICSLTENSDVKIRDGEESRPLKLSDFLVITRTKNNLDTYLSVFAERNIPVLVEGKTIFSKCASVMSAVSIMDAVSHPYDSMRVYSALTCPVFDFDDMEFSEYCLSGKRLILRREAEKTGQDDIIGAAMEMLAPLVRLAESAAPSVLYDAIIDTLPVFEKCGTEYLEYVYYAGELLREKEAGGEICNAADGAEFLKLLVTDTTDIERTLYLNREENSVHFANLHKVKGLEAPVIILGYSRKPGTNSLTPDSRWDVIDGKRVSFLFRFKKDYMILLSTSGYEEEKQKETVCTKQEFDRLLYVAGTRARNILIVSDSWKDRKQNFWEKMLPFTEKSIADAVCVERTALPERRSFKAGKVMAEAEKDSALSDRTALEQSYHVTLPSSLTVRNKEEEENVLSEPAEKISRENEKALLMGTMTHELMEKIVLSGNRLDTSELAGSIASEYSIDENDRDAYISVLRNVADTIRDGGYKQENGGPADILGEVLSADEAYCELPFCIRDGDGILNGIMDLVYSKDGKWYIVDYKTNADPSDLDEEYKGQLSAYVRAFKALTGNEAEPRIYHISV